MSFGGFGGFGSTNKTTSGTGFGAFGSTNNNNNAGTGFGSNTGTGFGGANTGGSLFGGGSNSGGFGSNTTTAKGFSSRPAFGGTGTTSTGGGLFGNTNTTATTNTGFGGFGSGNTTSAFGGGSSSAGGGLFGGNKPATAGFGASNTNTGAGLFGGGNASAGFGSNDAVATTGNSLFGGNGTALGGTVPECPGTGGTAFQAFQEKESNSSLNNHFQTITFMSPYQKYSLEELRLADYNQGRRFGNNSGQPGAFGGSTFGSGFGTINTNTNTGGFGTGGGPFGNNTNTGGTGFGNNAAMNSGFGSNNTAGGLFGGAKPATTGGGLFGNTTATTGGTNLFGGGNTAGGGFGLNTTQPATGGGMFGNNNSTANKPGGLFGGTGTTGGGLFGNNNNNTATTGNAGGLFGNTNNNQPANSNPFGTSTTNNNPFGGNAANNNPFGGANNNNNTGGGLFANLNTSQQKPGGLFGNVLGGSQPATTNPFGTINNNNNATKPNNLFGGGAGTTNTNPFGGATNTAGGGLFGNVNQQNQNPSGSLFGNPQIQNKPGGLFGNSTGVGSLFANQQPQQNNTSSLFGNGQQQNQPGGSVFANMNGTLSGNPQNPLQGPPGMSTSFNDATPYGSASIFHGLPPPPQASPGPIATPIAAGGLRQKKPAALPQYKINPAVAGRLMTPQKRGGFGFSYSTYGTPSSVSSVASTPGGFSSSLLGGSFGRSIGKSMSTSNLRGNYDGDSQSILSPGAFSASSQRYTAGGSLKRLTIDRNLRTDLFATSHKSPLALPPSQQLDKEKTNENVRPAPTLKKRVSFDTNSGVQPQLNGQADGSVEVPRDGKSANPTAQEQGFLRSSNRINGRKSAPPEMEQVKGNELAIVPEDDDTPEVTDRSPSKPASVSDQSDPQPGPYYSSPPLSELKKMPKDKLSSFPRLRIGRENCGYVDFEDPVDISRIDLDHVYDIIVVITIRSLTVYPENAHKPTVGNGLNVPSKITLANSWPRGRDRRTPSYEKSGPRYGKHVERLKKVGGTEYVSYNKDTGEWTFRVPHFTTYGLEYDEDESAMDQSGFKDSTMSDALPTPTPKSKVKGTPMPSRGVPLSSSVLSSVPSTDMMNVDEEPSQVSSGPEDTFGYRRRRTFPGAFDDVPAFEDDEEDEHMREMQQSGHSFFSLRAATPGSELTDPSDTEDGPHHAVGVVEQEDMSIDSPMIGAYPLNTYDSGDDGSSFDGKSAAAFDTPKLLPDLGDEWANRLQRTLSPRKMDRQMLRQSQALLDRPIDEDVDDTETLKKAMRMTTKKNPKTNAAMNGGEIKTSIDLMNSLFGQEELRRSTRPAPKVGQTEKKGFEV